MVAVATDVHFEWGLRFCSVFESVAVATEAQFEWGLRFCSVFESVAVATRRFTVFLGESAKFNCLRFDSA